MLPQGDMFGELLVEGLTSGLYWFPFVLGVGFLYKYLKIIDVSIDGIATVSIISFVLMWNETQLLAPSIGIAIVSAIAMYALFSFLVYELKINAVFAGIIFSLVLYSLSVIIIGESVPLRAGNYYPQLKLVGQILPLLSLALAALSYIFYKTKLGVAIRIVGENIKANTRYNRRLLLLLCFVVSGLLVGYASVGYAIRENVARSGGGFDFLINAMTSYLLVDRIIDYFVGRYSQRNEAGRLTRRFVFVSVLQNPIFKALIGSLLFQTLIILIIAYTPNPVYWKLILGAALILAVSKLQANTDKHLSCHQATGAFGITLNNVGFSYDVGYEKRVIFDDFSAKFSPGINVISGPNGVGKTTLLKLLNREAMPNAGSIAIESENHEIFYLRQEPIAVFARELPVYENVLQSLPHLANLSVTNASTLINLVDREVERYGLTFDILLDPSIWLKKAEGLSGGQLQKIACLMALLSDADIILADEPSSGLDDRNEELLRQFFYALAAQGKIIIIISHDYRLHQWSGKHFILRENKLSEKTDEV